jgi:hypothetical protein
MVLNLLHVSVMPCDGSDVHCDVLWECKQSETYFSSLLRSITVFHLFFLPIRYSCSSHGNPNESGPKNCSGVFVHVCVHACID